MRMGRTDETLGFDQLRQMKSVASFPHEQPHSTTLRETNAKFKGKAFPSGRADVSPPPGMAATRRPAREEEGVGCRR